MKHQKTTLADKKAAIIPLTTAFTALENHYNSSTTLKTAKLSDFTSLKQAHEALKNTLSTEEQATKTSIFKKHQTTIIASASAIAIALITALILIIKKRKK